jgi:hypothetical protein
VEMPRERRGAWRWLWATAHSRVLPLIARRCFDAQAAGQQFTCARTRGNI